VHPKTKENRVVFTADLLPGIENITCKHGKICLGWFGASPLLVLPVTHVQVWK
jgi:hypothetical protein